VIYVDVYLCIKTGRCCTGKNAEKMKLNQEVFEKAIDFAKNRRETTGDAQAGSAELEYSLIEEAEVVLINKPMSGSRFPIVTLTRVSIKDIA